MHLLHEKKDKSVDKLATKKRGWRNLKLMEHPVPLIPASSVRQPLSPDSWEQDEVFRL